MTIRKSNSKELNLVKVKSEWNKKSLNQGSSHPSLFLFVVGLRPLFQVSLGEMLFRLNGSFHLGVGLGFFVGLWFGIGGALPQPHDNNNDHGNNNQCEDDQKNNCRLGPLSKIWVVFKFFLLVFKFLFFFSKFLFLLLQLFNHLTKLIKFFLIVFLL